MTILDGDNPVIENVTGLSLDEAGVDQGSQEGAVVTSGSGSLTTAVGSDIIDHYELEPTEFNVGGQPVRQCSFGVRTRSVPLRV